MRLMKSISLLLALVLLASIGVTALMEEQIVDAAPLAEELIGVEGLTVDNGEADVEPEWTPEPDANTMIDAPVAEGRAYARVGTDGAAVYPSGEYDDAPAALLNVNDVVLTTGTMAARTPVAFFFDGAVRCGYMDAADLLPMDAAQTQAYLDDLAYSGNAALYQDDINWPLAPLTGVTYGDDRALLATTIPNDRNFVMNGKEFNAAMYGTANSGNCWRWCQALYKDVWGVNFNEKFAGTASTGMNLLANLNDAQRTTTMEHVRAFIQQTVPGATIRVCGCSTSCPCFENDGLGCGHKGHSMMVVAKDSDGFTIMDNISNHTRYYTWQGFADSWKNFTYIKYIKWPGAIPLPGTAVSTDGSIISVTGVSLSQSALNLNVGQSATLTAQLAPSNASNQKIEWSSSNEGVATVKEGVVIALSAGKTTIGVRTSDGGFTASCTLTVVKPTLQKALTKTGNNGTIVLGAGDEVQLSYDFATSKGWTVTGVKSSKGGVASASNSGLVFALSEGTAKITVSTKNKKKATVTVKVVDPNKPTAVALNYKGTVKMNVGETLQLQASLLPSNASTSFIWKSSKSKVATVNSGGLVTAQSEGKAKIAVATKNKKKAMVTVKVVDPNKPTAVALNQKGTVTLHVGDTLQLQAALQSSTASSTFTWKSSRSKVASVNASGLVTAQKKGTCLIGVRTSNGKYAKVKIKVVP